MATDSNPMTPTEISETDVARRLWSALRAVRSVRCADAIADGMTLIERLIAERDAARAVLRDHHEWHMQSGMIGLPDGDGGWIEMDNAAEYNDSRLYERTREVIDQMPPRLPVQPRAGSGSNHWENWQLAIREIRAIEKIIKSQIEGAERGEIVPQLSTLRFILDAMPHRVRRAAYRELTQEHKDD